MALTVIPKVAAIVDDIDVEKTIASFLTDHFIEGYTPSIGTGLAVNIAGNPGNARIKGHHINEGATSTAVAVPASTTSSIWLALTRDGNSKVNGAQYTVAVTQPADSIKICDFVSGVSTVTTVTDKRGALKVLLARQVQFVAAASLVVTSNGGTWVVIGVCDLSFSVGTGTSAVSQSVNLRSAAVIKDTKTHTMGNQSTVGAITYRASSALMFSEVIAAGSVTFDFTSGGTLANQKIIAVELM